MLCEEYKVNDKTFEQLKADILEEAKKDYAIAVAGLKAIEEDLVKYTEEDKLKLEYVVYDCITFFNSSWGKDCGIDNPDYIIEMLEKEAEKEYRKIVERREKRLKKGNIKKQKVTVPRI